MHWVTKYTNRKCHADSDMHFMDTMATLFNNHLYISSSKFSANWCATTYHPCTHGYDIVSLCGWIHALLK